MHNASRTGWRAGCVDGCRGPGPSRVPANGSAANRQRGLPGRTAPGRGGLLRRYRGRPALYFAAERASAPACGFGSWRWPGCEAGVWSGIVEVCLSPARGLPFPRVSIRSQVCRPADGRPRSRAFAIVARPLRPGAAAGGRGRRPRRVRVGRRGSGEPRGARPRGPRPRRDGGPGGGGQRGPQRDCPGGLRSRVLRARRRCGGAAGGGPARRSGCRSGRADPRAWPPHDPQDARDCALAAGGALRPRDRRSAAGRSRAKAAEGDRARTRLRRRRRHRGLRQGCALAAGRGLGHAKRRGGGGAGGRRSQARRRAVSRSGAAQAEPARGGGSVRSPDRGAGGSSRAPYGGCGGRSAVAPWSSRAGPTA